MNSINKKLIAAGIAVLMLAISPMTYSEPAPLPDGQLSNEAVSVIPSIEKYCDEGPLAECGTGLERISFEFDDGSCYGRYFGPITCNVDVDTDTVKWSLESNPSAPPPPFAIDSVILESCFKYEAPDESSGDRSIFYTYKYESPYGANTDRNLGFYKPDNTHWSTYSADAPMHISFCYNSQPNAETPGVAVIPACADTTVCPSDENSEETYLVEVSRLRDAEGLVLQPPAALDEETCVCRSANDPDDPLTQCDPAAGEGDPNACRDVDADGPGQVTRLDQWNGDPYFCTTVNGRRMCWAY